MADICVSSHHASIQALLADAEFRSLAGREGFLIELRMDYYSDVSIASLDKALDVFAPNVIATFRHPEEGGKNQSVSDSERLQYLQHAAERGVKMVDIEARTPRAKFKKHGAKLLLSYHDFKGLPAPKDGLLRLVISMFDNPDIDIVKIACFPKTVDEGLPLLELLIGIQQSKLPAIILAMGEAGFWTRIVGPLFGAPLTYSRGEGAPGTAPGQPTWRELEEIYRYRQMKPGWPVYGVIGNPIAHSLSPLLHNTALRDLKKDGVYIPFKVEGDPVKFMHSFAPLNLQGISVTIPHKESVQKLCKDLDPLAAQTGAVNTLVRKNDYWFGTNTDATAAADALEEAAGLLSGKKILILGAGGAARGVSFGLKAKGAELYVLNRTHQRAVELAGLVGGRAVTQADIPSLKLDAIINTTPIGMHPNVDQSPLKKEQIPEGIVVFDTVYNPLRTQLLQWASERGCKTVEGASMFLRQGVRQFELFTGAKANYKNAEKAVLEALKRRHAAQTSSS